MATFVYRDGDDVPRDVTRVVVHPSVRVLPPEAFRWCERLEVVRLNEGLEEIGPKAFYRCFSLRCLKGPRRGRRRRGERLVRIGDLAFWGCSKLSVVELNQGLEEIGREAFCECFSLRRFDVPPAAVRIGYGAFVGCSRLSAVEFAGITNVERNAFSRCGSLGRIGIPSRAFVVQQGFLDHLDRNYTCRLVTDGTVACTSDDPNWAFALIATSAEFSMIAPGCLTVLPKSNLTKLGNSIGTIMNSGEGTKEDRLDRVRQEVRKEVRGLVSAILGLAFWKAKIEEAERALMESANNHRKSRGGGKKRAKVGIVFTRKAREECRGEGKGKLIAQNVLPFLDGLWCKGSQEGPR